MYIQTQTYTYEYVHMSYIPLMQNLNKAATRCAASHKIHNM